MKKILVAYDGTEPARRALEMASQLVHAFGAELTVISVVPTRPGRFPTDPWDDQEQHTRQLVEARALLAEKGVQALAIEPFGDPAHEIERVAEKGDYDTIIVGARPIGEVSKILTGSVSRHVAEHANTTVVVAR